MTLSGLKKERLHIILCDLIVYNSIKRMKKSELRELHSIFIKMEKSIKQKISFNKERERFKEIIFKHLEKSSKQYILHDYSINKIGTTPFIIIFGFINELKELQIIKNNNFFVYLTYLVLKLLGKKVKASPEVIESYKSYIKKIREEYEQIKDKPTLQEKYPRRRF